VACATPKYFGGSATTHWGGRPAIVNEGFGFFLFF
jgi:hypothetical protein